MFLRRLSLASQIPYSFVHKLFSLQDFINYLLLSRLTEAFYAYGASTSKMISFCLITVSLMTFEESSLDIKFRWGLFNSSFYNNFDYALTYFS